jgi:DNA-binding transcriptional LysR family regulator
MAALRQFHVDHPQVSVRTDGLTSNRIYDELRSRRLDLGVARVVPGVTLDRDLVASPWATIPMEYVAVPAGHPWARRRRPVDASDFTGETLLVVDPIESAHVHSTTVDYFADRNVSVRWVTHAANQTERALDQVAAGLGLTWVNGWQAVAARQRRDVKMVRLVEPLRVDTFVLVHRRDPITSWIVPLVGSLMEAARNQVIASEESSPVLRAVNRREQGVA